LGGSYFGSIRIPKYGSLINKVRILIFYPSYNILVDLLNQNLLDKQEEFFLVALDFLQGIFFAAIQFELNDPE